MTAVTKIDDEASVQAGRRHLPLATRKLQPHDARDGQAGEQPAGNICQAEHAAHSAKTPSLTSVARNVDPVRRANRQKRTIGPDHCSGSSGFFQA